MAQREEEGSSSKTVWIVLGILAAVGFLFLAACGGLGYLVYRNVRDMSILNPDAATPGLELQNEDYALARTQFKTQLTRQGPAPQPWDPIQIPPGVRQVDYTSGGLRLKAWLSPAPAAGQRKQPAVLFLHGGFAFGDDDWFQCQPYRDSGFVTMTPILRGENGQSGSYSMFYDEVEDVLAAAELLAQQPYVDANRIYVSGHSVGGTLTLLAAQASKRFRAAASFSGSPDQVLWSQGQPDVVRFDPNNLREFQMRSPVAYAGSFKCPTRLYYGTDAGEFLFHASSQRTAKLAKDRGLDVQAIAVPGDHMSSVDAAMRQAIAFFRQQGAANESKP